MASNMNLLAAAQAAQKNHRSNIVFAVGLAAAQAAQKVRPVKGPCPRSLAAAQAAQKSWRRAFS